MYSAFFRHLPGPKWFRILFMVVLVLCLLAFLMEVAFPIVSEYMTNTESTVG